MGVIRSLRPCQNAFARAVLNSVLHRRGFTFTVEIAERGGAASSPRSLSWHCLALRTHSGGRVVKIAPSVEATGRGRLVRHLAEGRGQGLWSQEAAAIRVGRAEQFFMTLGAGPDTPEPSNAPRSSWGRGVRCGGLLPVPGAPSRRVQCHRGPLRGLLERRDLVRAGKAAKPGASRDRRPAAALSNPLAGSGPPFPLLCLIRRSTTLQDGRRPPVVPGPLRAPPLSGGRPAALRRPAPGNSGAPRTEPHLWARCYLGSIGPSPPCPPAGSAVGVYPLARRREHGPGHGSRGMAIPFRCAQQPAHR